MAILEMIGFEGYPTVVTNGNQLLTSGKGLVASVAVNFQPEVVNGRTRLYAPAGGVNLLYALSQLSSPAELKRVKHWGGFRFQPKLAATTSQPLLRFRFAYSTSSVTDLSPILFSALGTTAQQLNEVYVEWCIDAPNQVLMTWLDGVRQPDVVLPNATVMDTLRDITVYMGQDSTATLQTWNDFYFVKDTSDIEGDTTLSRRLGPVRVKALPVNAVELPAGWSVTSGTAVDALNTKTLNTPTTPVIRTGADESVGKIGFATPVNTWDIQAVSIRDWFFRDTGTTTSIVTQLKQGETLLEQVNTSANASTPRTGSSADRLGVYNRSLDGTPWTPAKLDLLEILVNSKSGG
ncbi:hypothetical protein D3C85_128300 [compost metagenome]